MKNGQPQFLSLSEAAERLGYAASTTLRRMAAAGRIPGAIKIGKTWVLPMAWVEQQKDAERPIRGWPRGAGTRKK